MTIIKDKSVKLTKLGSNLFWLSILGLVFSGGVPYGQCSFCGSNFQIGSKLFFILERIYVYSTIIFVFVCWCALALDVFYGKKRRDYD